MKSDTRTFVHSAVAAASKRPVVTAEPNRNQMFRFKATPLLLLLGLVAPMQSFAAAPAEAPYCIAVSGGFGNGGSTFVARNFSLPAASKCTPWTRQLLLEIRCLLVHGWHWDLDSCPKCGRVYGNR